MPTKTSAFCIWPFFKFWLNLSLLCSYNSLHPSATWYEWHSSGVELIRDHTVPVYVNSSSVRRDDVTFCGWDVISSSTESEVCVYYLQWFYRWDNTSWVNSKVDSNRTQEATRRESTVHLSHLVPIVKSQTGVNDDVWGFLRWVVRPKAEGQKIHQLIVKPRSYWWYGIGLGPEDVSIKEPPTIPLMYGSQHGGLQKWYLMLLSSPNQIYHKMSTELTQNILPV